VQAQTLPDRVPGDGLAAGYFIVISVIRIGQMHNSAHQTYRALETYEQFSSGLSRKTAFWSAVDFLIGRKVERISLGGIPLSAYAGRPRILELLEEARKRTDIPVTTDFEEAILALRHLGVRRVVAAAKWDEPLMDAVVAYLRHAGMEVLGSVGETHSAQQVVALRPDESIDIALQLGRRAFESYPEADGLLLAGGAWLVLQAVPQLEAEFGKPVVTNPCSSYWAALRQAGLHSPILGLGRLLDGLREASP
jgi:maleate cis-trans isomerase